MPRLFHCILIVCGSLVATGGLADEPLKPVTAVVPDQTIALLNGKDLSAWYSYLDGHGNKDPRGVFKLQGDGTLRISGEVFGGLITHKEYANYHLVMEYRWGTATWSTRKGKARDSGVLLHCHGPDGSFVGSDGPGPWMASVECQIIEGGVGDILVLTGKNATGQRIETTATSEISRDRDGEAVWSAGGKSTRFTGGRINWFGRDPDWQDITGYRGKGDVESPGQEWTKLECFAKHDTLTYRVNGTVVNRATRVSPAQGKILLQTEGAELFVRRLELHPLPDKIPGTD